MEVSVEDAARRLSMSQQRVRVLAAAGRIPARKLGRRAWAIDLDRVERGLGQSARGRPLSARSSWAILDLLAGREPQGLSRSERIRARARLAAIADSESGELAARARAVRLVAHRGLSARLADDPRMVLGGVTAGSHYGADLAALDQVEGYVRAEDLERLVAEYALMTPSTGLRPNVLLRIPVSRWPFAADERIAHRAVVGVDLIDAADERSVRAGRKLLASLVPSP